MTEAQVKPSLTDNNENQRSLVCGMRVSVQERVSAARYCDRVRLGQNDHVLRRFFETTALPNLRRLRIESPTWERGSGELFLGLAARGRPLEEMIVTTSLDLAKTRLVTFKVRFAGGGNLISEYSFPRQPLLDGELEAAAVGLGLPSPLIPADTPARTTRTTLEGVVHLLASVDTP